MTDIRKVTDGFSVAPQVGADELGAVAAAGFVLVINNRPDGEQPGQPTSAEMAEAAQAAGLDYLHVPVRGGPGREQVEAVAEAVAAAKGPVLAFCRSGTRSIVTWSLGQAMSGARSPEELVKLGAGAGYDLSGVLGA
ncbi:MAG: TIGR01244 family phosphatase [Caulobacteraceae bacterium]|nr:TIGR01244 family phosphatase [Caulobacteraceae bacterium]